MGWMFLCLAHKWWPPLKKFAAVEAANATPTASLKFRDVMSQNFARAKLLETTLPSSQPRCRCGPSPGAWPHAHTRALADIAYVSVTGLAEPQGVSRTI